MVESGLPQPDELPRLARPPGDARLYAPATSSAPTGCSRGSSSCSPNNAVAARRSRPVKARMRRCAPAAVDPDPARHRRCNRRPAGRRPRAGICGRSRSPPTAAWRRRRSRSPAASSPPIRARPTGATPCSPIASCRRPIRRSISTSGGCSAPARRWPASATISKSPRRCRPPAFRARPRRCWTRAWRATCSIRPSVPPRQRTAINQRARRRAAPPCRGFAPRRRPPPPAPPRAPPATPISATANMPRRRSSIASPSRRAARMPNLVNSRLGAALALAGRRPEAEAALRAVTGPRADLAGFWLTWLARGPPAG